MKNVGDIQCGPVLAPIIIGLNNLLARGSAERSADPELDWEIRLFAWILENPNAETRALDYCRRRHLGPEMKSKRQVVRELGWRIP